MKDEEILQYLRLVDRRTEIILSSGIGWKKEYEKELKDIDRKLGPLRALVDQEHSRIQRRGGAAREDAGGRKEREQ